MYQPTTTRSPPPPPRRHNSLQIEISGIPAENGKCRVETQLKIALHIKDAQNESVKDWKQLRLPHSLIAKEKHRMEKFNGRSKHIEDSEILTLDARLVCDHDMTKILECCDNCIGRERKRAHRRKESQKLPGPLSIPIFGSINPKNGPVSLADEPIPPTPTDPVEYQAWERHRIMVFSSTEYVDISSGQCLLPTRITCYCRHHNEKVGFRIQFTAKDSTGAVVASVLSNAVMMMDDHKSGKRPTAGTAKSTSSTAARKKAGATGASNGSTAAGSTENRDDDDLNGQQNDDDDDQEDLDQDDAGQGDGDEIDLEAGHHIPQHGFAPNSMKFEDAEMTLGDILTPLSSAAERLGAKRRVDENAMDGVQTQSDVDPSRGPFRRKTSHDIPQGIGAPASFVSSSHTFASSLPTGSLASPSPFMPGSPFANDSQHNTFSPSYSQALDGSFLDQKNIDMFLATGLPPSVTQQNGFHKFSKDTVESESSMMEFTTLDETMGSPPDAFQVSSVSTNSTSISHSSEHAPQSTATTSQALPTRASFSIPAPAFAPTSTASSNPFSPTGMLTSAFSTTFSAPMNGPASSSSLVNAPGMSSSFLNPTQMQEFQNFQRQSVTQQKQQQLLLQLQQGVQNQSKQQMDAKQVPWTANKADNKDPYWKMRMAMSQTTSPSSSAFIPIPTSLPEDSDKAATPKPNADTNATGTSTPTADTPLAPKKRGRPRKSAAPTASEASSPVLSALPPTPIQSSPSLSLASLVPPSSAAASAAAAQFLLFQQRQQQQLQHHQQQLQQQQKQAILARQKPRVQKLIPSRGPVEGGVEITLLGSGFFPGMVPTFDGVPAQNVQYYGPETVICRLPPRSFPGSVVVKAQSQLSAAVAAGPGTSTDDPNSNELVRTMTQLFGGPTAAQQILGDDDVGVLFEYEESKGDRELIALALQVLGMKMSGRVEPPHQVAMRIMGTAAASNAIMGQEINTLSAGSSSTSQQSLQMQQLQLQQQQQQQQQHQRALLGFGQQLNGLQPNGLAQQQQQGQSAFQPQSSQSSGLANGGALGAGMLGFGGFLNSNPGANGGGGI
ncbi:hypothetical protein BG015_008442 [Linnemannia schmuckeri]|uniref:IPT/TIG domain-containing protein n=1 Tax=Linnemannia schmuckeri TaxID=64567 RepID=A0A9P5RWX6_9FUNG|nr:hypothetical protein BG015_008442 [Linnemannia schmuckeri]